MSFIEGITTNNSSHEINNRFGGKLFEALDKRLGLTSPPSLVTVCDIACGPEARSIGEIVREKRGRVRGLGLDFLLALPKKSQELVTIRGDLLDIDPEFYEQADISYCAHIISKLAQYRDGYLGLLSLSLSSISSTLRVGGVAFVDESIYSAGYDIFPLENLRQGIAKINPQFLDKFSLEKQESGQLGGSFLQVSRNE